MTSLENKACRTVCMRNSHWHCCNCWKSDVSLLSVTVSSSCKVLHVIWEKISSCKVLQVSAVLTAACFLFQTASLGFFSVNDLLICLYVRTNGNERPTQMEHHDNSDWDECDVSQQPTWLMWSVQILKCLKSFLPSSGPLLFCAPKVGLHTVLCVSFSLLILTVMNLGLFFKLWAMEDIAHRMYLSTKHRLRERSEARWDNSPSLCIMHPLGLFSILDSDDVSCCMSTHKADVLCGWREEASSSSSTFLSVLPTYKRALCSSGSQCGKCLDSLVSVLFCFQHF